MRALLSDRGSAALLLGSAVLALLLAATPIGPALIVVRGTELPVGAAGPHLTVGHLISDGLLAVFFLLVAIELRHELTHGELARPSAALVPAVAAAGGVLVPAGLYLLLAGGAAPQGWPVPTATDIAFALGLLALVGRGLPTRVRAFLLALAILDDLVAILLIAVVFPTALQPLWLVPAAVLCALFAVGARSAPPAIRAVLLWVLGIAAWYCTWRSGVHPTLAGVALGLLLPAGVAARADARLQPVSRLVVLPLFAFSAGLVRLQTVVLSAPFTGIALALPAGKFVGILLFGTAAGLLLGRRSPSRLTAPELCVVGLVSGVGFTVSLLMADLAFRGSPLGDSAALGVLTGSLVAIVLSAAVVPVLARRIRARPH